jgi:aryl-phospho-beta-D-glucosidase BglC (GH1 family)
MLSKFVLKMISGTFVLVSSFLCHWAMAQYPAGSPVAVNGKLQVIGPYVRNECGNPVQLRGMSTHGVQWFGNCANPSSLDALAKNWHVDVFRIAMYIQEGGYATNPTYWKGWVDNIVAECGKRGIYAIIDFHVHIPGDPVLYLDQAKEFWTYMATKHKDDKHVLYEICNEPNGVPWSRVKEYANQVIPLIRAIDTKTMIIVGSSTWSQDVDQVAADRLNYPNLSYALHFYTQGEALRIKATIAWSKGLPLFVSEFGTSDAQNRAGPYYDEMEVWNAWLEDRKVSWANWTFSDKSEPSAALLPGSCGGNSWDNTTASGTWVKNKMNTPLDNFVCNGDTLYAKASSTPYFGTPMSIPGKIEAENYDLGLQGVAYRDLSPGNLGSMKTYRLDDVDISYCNDTGSGFFVEKVQAGEWLNYTVNVQASGKYDFKIRLVSTNPGKQIYLQVNDKNISGLLDVPVSTSGIFQTLTIPNVTLTQGVQDLRIFFIHPDPYINYIQVKPSLGNPTNMPPDVFITSPLYSQGLAPTLNPTIQATATDPDGKVKKVEFYQGGVKLGEDTTYPYSFVWANPLSGTYKLTAKAIDNLGAATMSAEILFTVKNAAPTSYLTSPANNASFLTNSLIKISADSKDPGGSVVKVEFYSGTTKIGEDTSSPYSITWSSTLSGTYSLTAKSIDNSGLATVSSVTTILINDPLTGKPPVVTLSSPISGATFTAPAMISLSATASDADGTVSKVEFYNGTVKLGQVLSSPYTFVWSSVPAGPYTITAKATDNSGNISTSAGVAITVTSITVNQPPVVTLSSPVSGATFTAPATISLSATASDADGTISKVEFYNGSTKLGEALSGPYTFVWSGVPAGPYTITAKATDNSGNISTSAGVAITVTSIVPNQPPVVTLSSPVSGATFTAPATISLSATASDADGTISKVEFYNGSAKLGEALSSPYTFVWSNVSAGPYTITAKATDNSGASSTSSPAAITVSSSAPPSCITEAIPTATDWVLRNDWTDQFNASDVSTQADGMHVTHRAWGEDRVYIIETGKSLAVSTTKKYTISFDFKNDAVMTVKNLQIGFATGASGSGPILAQPLVSIPAGTASGTFSNQSVTLVPVNSASVYLSIGLLWPSQISAQSNTVIKNISICSTGVNARVEETIAEEDILESGALSNLVIVPNPSENHFSIKIKGDQDDLKISVYNLTGNIVYASDTHPSNTEFYLGEDWPRGVFILKAQLGSSVLVSKLRKF